MRLIDIPSRKARDTAVIPAAFRQELLTELDATCCRIVTGRIYHDQARSQSNLIMFDPWSYAQTRATLLPLTQ